MFIGPAPIPNTTAPHESPEIAEYVCAHVLGRCFGLFDSGQTVRANLGGWRGPRLVFEDFFEDVEGLWVIW